MQVRLKPYIRVDPTIKPTDSDSGDGPATPPSRSRRVTL